MLFTLKMSRSSCADSSQGGVQFPTGGDVQLLFNLYQPASGFLIWRQPVEKCQQIRCDSGADG
jgi:hypothetical protein